MKNLAYLVLNVCLCVVGCSEDPKSSTINEYMKVYGSPDLVAKVIRVEDHQGLRVVVVESPLDRFTNGVIDSKLRSFSMLFASHPELKWSLNQYYLERSSGTNSSEGMYHPTRTWFGEKITIVKVDSAGNVQDVVGAKIDALSIRERVRAD